MSGRSCPSDQAGEDRSTPVDPEDPDETFLVNRKSSIVKIQTLLKVLLKMRQGADQC